jgi:hypothetical protein
MPRAEPKSETVQIRLTNSEKRGFEQAAALAGIPISAWVRERLRLAAIHELEAAGQRVPFVPVFSVGGNSGQ